MPKYGKKCCKVKRNGIEWAIMINKFGFPVKDYHRLDEPVAQVGYLDVSVSETLKAVRALGDFLTEKAIVPRRVSALNR